ncbi:MAG: hypothetical protein K2H30_03580 [Clostridia bacterium]|nr:hypothetical protein [Clostridia bacterium]
MEKTGIKIPPAKQIAYVAVMCALLIAGQYVFSFVVGVEIVTLLMICFSSVFGVRSGVICAVSFSLLRCLIYGFSPTAVILYLVYYPSLAAVFGGLGHIKDNTFGRCPAGLVIAVNLLLCSLAAACALVYGFDVIKVSRLWKATADILIWVIFGLSCLLLLAFNALVVANKIFKKNVGAFLKLFTFASVAAVCTVCFTLLDDVITPLVLGSTRLTALTYFYASFTAMLPQTVCAIVTVSTLYLPLCAALKKATQHK